MLLTVVLLAGSAVLGVPPAGNGLIEGVVVNAANGKEMPGAEVVLRAKVRDQPIPVAETTADAQGKFRFERLSTDGAQLYLPGANCDGIHYPGPTVRLSPVNRRSEVRLTVCNAVTFPNPLVVRRHTITLHPRPGALQVTESMLIDNPSAACYVGRAASQSAEPVTLQLAIPADFQQVTFASEFFGRRFAVVGGALVTSVPWQPGQRELTFSYVLANSQRHYVWQRPLDLPSANVRVLLSSDQSGQDSSNLKLALQRGDGEVKFESGGQTLSAGYLLRVELGDMPVSLMTYAPAAAIVMLAGLILATCLPVLRRRRYIRHTA